MVPSENRWALPDLQSVVDLCASELPEYPMSIDVQEEYARRATSGSSVEVYLSVADGISDYRLEASLTVKLSALGPLRLGHVPRKR